MMPPQLGINTVICKKKARPFKICGNSFSEFQNEDGIVQVDLVDGLGGTLCPDMELTMMI